MGDTLIRCPYRSSINCPKDVSGNKEKQPQPIAFPEKLHHSLDSAEASQSWLCNQVSRKVTESPRPARPLGWDQASIFKAPPGGFIHNKVEV